MKFKTLIAMVILGFGAVSVANEDAWAKIVRDNAYETFYGQVNGPTYVGINATLINYGQLNGDVLCNGGYLINYGQINGRIHHCPSPGAVN